MASIPEGFLEKLGEVVHFPYQQVSRSARPTIFNPHDLQHLHFPEYFTPQEIERRETVYRAGCRAAHTVVVASQWIKEDISRQYGTSQNKIQIIPWAAPTDAYAAPSEQRLATVRARYHIKRPFALYPAMTWPHKNHLRLLQALAILRDHRRVRIHLVCTGHKRSHWATIEQEIDRLRLHDQVQFLGFLPAEDLRGLYQLAQFVVIPTLFEAASAPLFEAWRDKAPVACASVTSLPEQARDAALLFDPFRVEAIADAVDQMASDAALRERLVQAGRGRLADFDWEWTAKAYRAVYRRAGGHPLTKEDERLLSRDWTAGLPHNSFQREP